MEIAVKSIQFSLNETEKAICEGLQLLHPTSKEFYLNCLYQKYSDLPLKTMNFGHAARELESLVRELLTGIPQGKGKPSKPGEGHQDSIYLVFGGEELAKRNNQIEIANSWIKLIKSYPLNKFAHRKDLDIRKEDAFHYPFEILEKILFRLVGTKTARIERAKIMCNASNLNETQINAILNLCYEVEVSKHVFTNHPSAKVIEHLIRSNYFSTLTSDNELKYGTASLIACCKLCEQYQLSTELILDLIDQLARILETKGIETDNIEYYYLRLLSYLDGNHINTHHIALITKLILEGASEKRLSYGLHYLVEKITLHPHYRSDFDMLIFAPFCKSTLGVQNTTWDGDPYILDELSSTIIKNCKPVDLFRQIELLENEILRIEITNRYVFLPWDLPSLAPHEVSSGDIPAIITHIRQIIERCIEETDLMPQIISILLRFLQYESSVLIRIAIYISSFNQIDIEEVSPFILDRPWQNIDFSHELWRLISSRCGDIIASKTLCHQYIEKIKSLKYLEKNDALDGRLSAKAWQLLNVFRQKGLDIELNDLDLMPETHYRNSIPEGLPYYFGISGDGKTQLADELLIQTQKYINLLTSFSTLQAIEHINSQPLDLIGISNLFSTKTRITGETFEQYSSKLSIEKLNALIENLGKLSPEYTKYAINIIIKNSNNNFQKLIQNLKPFIVNLKQLPDKTSTYEIIRATLDSMESSNKEIPKDENGLGDVLNVFENIFRLIKFEKNRPKRDDIIMTAINSFYYMTCNIIIKTMLDNNECSIKNKLYILNFLLKQTKLYNDPTLYFALGKSFISIYDLSSTIAIRIIDKIAKHVTDTKSIVPYYFTVGLLYGYKHIAAHSSYSFVRSKILIKLNISNEWITSEVTASVLHNHAISEAGIIYNNKYNEESFLHLLLKSKINKLVSKLIPNYCAYLPSRNANTMYRQIFKYYKTTSEIPDLCLLIGATKPGKLLDFHVKLIEKVSQTKIDNLGRHVDELMQHAEKTPLRVLMILQIYQTKDEYILDWRKEAQGIFRALYLSNIDKEPINELLEKYVSKYNSPELVALYSEFNNTPIPIEPRKP